MHKAYARQQGNNEPITSFITNIRLIFNQMEQKLPLSRQLDIRCNNLNPNFIPYIRRSQMKSFEELTDEGKEVELNIEEMKNYKGPPNPASSIVKNAIWPKKSPAQTNNSSKKAPEKEELSAMKSTAFSAKRGPTPEIPKNAIVIENTEKINKNDIEDMPNLGECFKCRQQSHLFNDCPNPEKYEIFCYSCGKGKVTVPKCLNCKDLSKKNE